MTMELYVFFIPTYLNRVCELLIYIVGMELYNSN